MRAPQAIVTACQSSSLIADLYNNRKNTPCNQVYRGWLRCYFEEQFMELSLKHP